MVNFDLETLYKCLEDAQKTLAEIGHAVEAKLLFFGGGALLTACIGVGGKNKTVNLHPNHRSPTCSGLNPVSVV